MRTNYQILLSGKDPTPALERWRGASAAVWTYTVSHRVLELRLYRSGAPRCLCIYCGDVEHLSGAVKWNDSSLEFERIGPDTVILRDRRAGFEVRAGVVAASEIDPP
jgi:hypothetical protein